MAETAPSPLLQGIRHLLWGPAIKPDIFKRWSQGFYFSSSEPTALEQSEGGPCAIIAPVQAFIIKNLILKFRDLSFRDKGVTTEMQDQWLIGALCEMLEQCNSEKYYVVYLDCLHSENIREGETSGENGEVCDVTVGEDPCQFHDNLRIQVFNQLCEVRKYYEENTGQLRARYGVLLFLYSVIATRRLEQIQCDNSNDTTDPLIDDTYGYGSQSVINLMITGRATTYVWDHEQDVGGLKLKGLDKQSQIGFITLMEHLRYCTVGSFYKNPIHPVWVLASDTHLTTLFSTERRLVSPETKTDQARRVFKHFDPEGNNFINAALLQDVLSALDLVSEEAYVKVMEQRLDPEKLGIILLNDFMAEFFPKEDNSMPDLFALVHCNSLAQSNLNGQITYREGECVLLESDLRAVSESNPMLTVLQTKWPNIEVRWSENTTPSLN